MYSFETGIYVSLLVANLKIVVHTLCEGSFQVDQTPQASFWPKTTDWQPLLQYIPQEIPVEKL